VHRLHAPCRRWQRQQSQIYGDRRRTSQAMADAGTGAGGAGVGDCCIM
jgi:hypothetical protein